MHYKNGREAKNGDAVIGRIYGNVVVGLIQDIQPGSQTCNCTVIRPGGLIGSCITVGELFHADDALDAANNAETARQLAGSPAPAEASAQT